MKKTKKDIFKLICLVLYLFLSATLIIESCINGTDSTQQSNAIGGTLADIFNDLSGDQSKKIEPTSLTINNKTSQADVGMKFTLSTTTLPENCTYTSLEFISSNTQIASIDNKGQVSCLKEGEVTITAQNKDFSHIKDSFNLLIQEVEAESFITSIGNARYVEETNTYYLETDKTYTISNTFTPSNTTNKSISYQLSSNEFISIQNNLITPLKHSFNQKTVLTISHKSLSHNINIIVKSPYIHDIDDFTIDDMNIYVGESLSPSITYSPNNPTYKDYQLTSTSPNIKIENNVITGLTESNNNEVTIKLNNYALEKKFFVNVKPLETIKDFTPRVPYLVENQTSKIYFVDVDPHASLDSLSFESSDNNIVQVDNNGNLTLLKEGDALIHISNQFTSKSINIKVHPQNETSSTFTINNEVEVLYNNTYSLNELLNPVFENTLNQDISIFSVNSDFVDLTNNELTIKNIGETKLLVTHKASGITQEVTLISHDDFSIINDDIEINNLTINTFETTSLSINDNLLQTYQFTHPSSLIVNQLNEREFSLVSLEEGEIPLTINAYYQNKNLYAKTITINSQNTSLNNQNLLFGCNLVDSKNTIRSDNPQKFIINRLSTGFYLKPFAYPQSLQDQFTKDNISKLNNEELLALRQNEIDFNKITNHNLSLTSNDTNILKIQKSGDKYKLIPVGLGQAMVTIQEPISQQSLEIKIGIYNYIRMQDNPFSLTGSDVKKEADNLYSVTNNSSLTLKLNFIENQTSYFDTVFTSSNPEVASIGQDGVITTLKEGSTKIKAVCYDGVSPKHLINLATGESLENYYECEITLEVKPKKLITDLGSFFIKVRKSIGHFGAFLVLGIFSTFTYLMYFDSKKWKISLPINFAQGILLAAITEIIQLFVPGRVGLLSDVLIDSLGFLISSIIITGIFLFKHFHKKSYDKKS